MRTPPNRVPPAPTGTGSVETDPSGLDALHAGDPRLPAVRARLALLAWSLWEARVMDFTHVPLQPAPADPPSLWLLAPLWQRARLHLLAGELLGRILPEIERWLAASGEFYQESADLSPTGPIHWPATWRRALAEGRPSPQTLISRCWQRVLDVPPNRLAANALALIASDARVMLARPPALPERRAIASCAQRAAQALARPPWLSLQPGGDAWASGREHAAASEPIIQRMPAAQRTPYAHLLDWWRRYHEWRGVLHGPTPVMTPDIDPDLLFELLALLELVAALARHLTVYQARPLAGPGADPARPLFRAYHPAGEIAVFYQTGGMFAEGRRLATVWGTPDVVIRLPDGRYVIVDAKNYGAANHSQALYKLMGYLYNFGYNPRFLPDHPPPEALFRSFERIAAGALIFPSSEREGYGLRAWHDREAGGQAIYSLVLPPVPDERFNGLQTLAAWILTEANRST